MSKSFSEPKRLALKPEQAEPCHWCGCIPEDEVCVQWVTYHITGAYYSPVYCSDECREVYLSITV